jgi:hypothetical protein
MDFAARCYVVSSFLFMYQASIQLIFSTIISSFMQRFGTSSVKYPPLTPTYSILSEVTFNGNNVTKEFKILACRGRARTPYAGH